MGNGSKITHNQVKPTEQPDDPAHPTSDAMRDLDRQAREQICRSLVTRLRHGDHEAAAELVDLYYDRLYLFMRAVGHDRHLSEDLTQETFLRAWHHIAQLRDGKALNAWLFRIAANVSNLHWRRRKGREQVSLDDLDPGAPQASGVNEALYREQLRRLRQAVARLPWRLRQAIVLHYMEHLTIAEAAQAANVRAGTFKSRLNRALASLREAMK